MGPLAHALVGLGYRVTGSDDRPTPPVSDFLELEGIHCHPSFAAENVPADADLVLANAFYGPENPELRRAAELGIPVSNFPRFLGEHFLARRRNAVVAGSYGKTTTTSMLAWIMEYAGLSPSWLVGGECDNLSGPVRITGSDYWVLEGDEYRSGPDDPAPKFSYYHPELAVITALDDVHQDQFASIDDAVKLYDELVRRAGARHPVWMADGPLQRQKLHHLRRGKLLATVGFEATADIKLEACRDGSDGNRFRLRGVPFKLSLHGDFSCVNAALASLAAEAWGVDLECSAEALARYRGVRWRQEVVADTAQLTVVYDMAYHPGTIGAVVEAVRQAAPGRRFCVLYQPRYTMGDEPDYYARMGRAFSGVDRLLVTDPPVPQDGVCDWFTFDAAKLSRATGRPLTEVGPALQCYPSWEAEQKPGDTWLILVEPMFPEPLNSIREYCRPKV